MRMMFNRRDKKTKLEAQIETVVEQLSSMDPSSKEYNELLGVLERLTKLKDKGHTKEVPWGTIITCSVALLQTIMILHAERVGIITSKAVGFIMKGRA